MPSRKIHGGMGMCPRHCCSVHRSQRSGSHDDSKTLKFGENFSLSPCFRMNYRRKPADSPNCATSPRKLWSNMGQGNLVVQVLVRVLAHCTLHIAWACRQIHKVLYLASWLLSEVTLVDKPSHTTCSHEDTRQVPSGKLPQCISCLPILL